MKVNVKWGKETFSDVELDLSQPPLMFKTQLFTLSGVPPDRQKIMIKGGLLKDDDWGKQQPKEGQTLMMMGSADPIAAVEPPKNAPTFVEDLPEDKQAALMQTHFGTGLANLGNTCYMNATLQCLFSVEGLRKAIASYSGPSTEPTGKLVSAAKQLFADMANGGEPFPPYQFLMVLRQRYPQFAQTGNQGMPMQQDAEECFTQLMYSLREQVKDGEESAVDKLFGVKLHTRLTCPETQESFEEVSTSHMLKCNIASDTNYLHQGLALGLKEDREKSSAQLGRLALFTGSSQVASLPAVLNIQLVRFFYKVDVQQKAKILRKVTYPLELDMYDFCSDELKKQLEAPRAAHKAAEDAAVERAKRIKLDKSKPTDKPAEAPAAETSAAGDVEMKDAEPSTSAAAAGSHVGALTGKYRLTGVLTHKGRSADSGHYVSWIKQKDGSWMLYDDDQLVPKTDEDVLALCGGGDWHMAYLLLYEAVRVPVQQS